MKIHLPNSAFLGNVDPLLRGFDPSNPETLEITTNDKWVSVHPFVLSLVASIGLTVKPENIKCEKIEARSKGYLARMNLFKMLNIAFSMDIVEHDPTGRFIPLTQIRSSEEASKFIPEMIPLLKVTPEQAETIVHILSELVRNVLEHSGSPGGAVVCAQYYPKTNRIGIGISDAGVGIKKTINFAHKTRTDMEAIQLALSPGVTGMTDKAGGTERNAGFGLFYIKSIASVNGDHFVIYSGNGFYKLLRKQSDSVRALRLNADPFRDRHSKEEFQAVFNGTAVGIDMTLKQTREFSVLIQAIGDVYRKAIKEKKKGRYKGPTFI